MLTLCGLIFRVRVLNYFWAYEEHAYFLGKNRVFVLFVLAPKMKNMRVSDAFFLSMYGHHAGHLRSVSVVFQSVA